MLKNKNLIIWVVVAVAGAGLILYSYFSKQAENPESTATPLPTASPTEEPFSGLHGIKSPATCQVGGEINFSSSDTFSSNGSKISWQNVDSQGRLINWHISPRDDLKIGPNIFANLSVPNGEYQNLTVRLPENPTSKIYALTASVTYGQFIKGDLKVKETNCTGQIKVNLNF
ncbi:MAG: hypothetical protein A3J46_06910 [Candidatus Yanofskybacteria bacterium RIFCSPHIGHO2_02_FULL_41_11]|uniref:Uncharacterized protein n=1 Tax=Candidatus Yanofskybacteria bacterium RIFCSPHIGHO2_02_FULL_41_11 TaxID=1802675 RepID=A0A1F8FAA3_9BACT|nr:MAG: hypothetical protein A3J46_06910 [Candidatus Yanofskybacteria bacterium RIFCSPHIGHO2_02_FULL_41_11]